jgi:protoheme IX farnesyltransferase
MAASCICNNYHDRFLDQKMQRTQNRALAKGSISTTKALVTAFCLLLIGSILLFSFTNVLTLISALIGFIAYVFVYTPLKTRSVHGTLIGSISGAMPPVVGYVAQSCLLDIGALILFLMITFWQMPHFYAIAMYRLKDYQAAGVPVLPAVKGNQETKIQMVVYTALFGVTSLLPAFYGYCGKIYLATAFVLGLYWLRLAFKGFKASCDIKWAKSMFGFSLVVVMIISTVLSMNPA